MAEGREGITLPSAVIPCVEATCARVPLTPMMDSVAGCCPCCAGGIAQHWAYVQTVKMLLPGLYTPDDEPVSRKRKSMRLLCGITLFSPGRDLGFRFRGRNIRL